MEKSIFNRNIEDISSRAQRVNDITMGIRNANRIGSPIAAIDTQYDRELNESPVDDYEALYNITKENPESTLKEANWISDASNTFLNSRDNINIMTAGGSLVKDVLPTLEDIDFELGVLNDKVKLEQLNDILPTLEKESDEYYSTIGQIGVLSDSIANREKKYKDILNKYGEEEGDDLNARIEYLNNSKESWLNKKQELEDEINSLRDNIEKRGEASSIYSFLEQNSHDKSLTDLDYWKYAIPGIAGSSMATIETYVGNALLSASIWGGKYLASTAATNATPITAAASKLIGAIGMTAVAASSIALDLYSRNRESLAQVYGAYKDKVKQDLDNQGIDSSTYIQAAREKLLEENPNIDKRQLTDDAVLDRILTGQVDVKDETLKTIEDNAKSGLESVYSNNMALSAWDIANQAILLTPIRGAYVKGLLKPIFKPVTKVAETIGKSKIGSKVTSAIDKYTEFNAKLAHQSPKKYATLEAAKFLGKLGFSSVGEAMEEGNQDIFDYDYINGKYDNKSAGLFGSISNLVNANYRTAKIISGIDTESELANDPMFWNDVKGGFALGMLMGGTISSVPTSVGMYKDFKANKFVHDVVIDQIAKKDIMDKSMAYSNFATDGRLNYQDNVINSIEKFKKYKEEGITDEDIDNEIKLANDTFTLSRSKNNRKLAEDSDIVYGSQEYNVLVGLQNIAKEDVKEANENYRQAVEGNLKFISNLNDNDIIKTLPEEDRANAAAITALNIQKTAISQLKEAVTAEKGKDNFGITDKKKPIVKAYLSKLNNLEKQIDEQLVSLTQDSKFDKDYIADNSILEEGVANYANVLLSEADSEVAVGKMNEIFGSAYVDGKLTNFNKLDKKTKSKVSKNIKKRVTDYINNVQESARVANNNAKKIVEEEKAKEPQTQETKPSTVEQDNTPKSKVFSPAGKPSIDTSIPTPKIDEAVEEDEEIILPDTDLEEIKSKKEPSLDDALSTFEKLKAKALQEADEEVKPEVKEETKKPSKEDKQVTEEPVIEEDEEEIDINEVGISSKSTGIDDSGEMEESSDSKKPVVKAQDDKLYEAPAKDKGVKEAEKSQSDATLAEKEQQAIEQLNLERRLQEGEYDNLLENEDFQDSDLNDKVSRTLFYDSKSETPLMKGHKPGKELSKLLEQPGALSEATLEFVINEEYKPEGKSLYKKGDRSTYDNTPLLLVIKHSTGTYSMALKTPSTADRLLANKTDNEKAEIIERLRSFRNQIIEAIENKKPNEKVIPTTVRVSNGLYNTNIQIKNGVALSVQRPIQNIPALSHNGFFEFGIGRGIGRTGALGQQIISEGGEQLPGKGGSGQLFVYPPTSNTLSGRKLPVQVNVSRFTPEIAKFIINLIRTYSKAGLNSNVKDTTLKVNDLINFIVRFGAETAVESNDARFAFLKEKQFYLTPEGSLVIGNKTYRDVTNLTDAQVDEISKFISDTMHWRINRDNFWKPLQEALPGLIEYFNANPRTGIFNISDLYGITLDELNENITVAQWMLKNNLLKSNLKDNLFKDPFVYADGFTVMTDDSLNPENLKNDGESAVGLTSLDDAHNLPVDDQPGIDSTTDDDIDQGELNKAVENAKKGIDILSDFADLGAFRKVEKKEYKSTITSEEIDWVKRKLGVSSDQIEIVENAIALGNDTFAMGLARAYSIVLWKGAEIGTAYHEAFHRVSLLLITPKERRKIYETYRNRTGFVGDDKMLEEALAEDFREYMLNNADTKLNIVKRAFKAIKNFISKWVFHTDTTIDNIFSRINSGYYSNKIINKEALVEFKQNYNNTTGAPFTVNNHKFKHITNPQFNEVIDSLTAITIKLNGIQTSETVSEVDFTKIKTALHPDVSSNLVDSGKLTQAQAEVRNEVYEQFDNVFRAEIIKKLRGYQLRDVDKKENIDEEIQAKADGETVGDAMSSYTKDAIEISAKNNALASVKIFIATLPKYKFVEGGKPGEIEPVVSPITGLPMCEKYDEAMNLVMNKIHDCYTFNDILIRCEELGKTYPLFSALHKKLKTLTIPVENESEQTKIAKENLQTQIRNTFRKAKNQIVGIFSTFERTTGGDRLSKLVVRDENSNKEVEIQIAGWTNELIRNTNIISFEDNKYGITEEGVEKLDKIKSFIDGTGSNKAYLLKVLKNYKSDPNFKTASGKTRRQALIDNLPSIKAKLVADLNDIGIRIDIETFNALIKSKYANPDAVDAFASFILDSGVDGITHFLTETLPLLKTIGETGKITRTVRNKDYSYTIEGLYKNNGFVKSVAQVYNTLNPNPIEMSVLAADGKLLYPISDHNYLSDTTLRYDTNHDIINKMKGVTYVTGKNEKDNYFKGSSILTNLVNNPDGRGKIMTKTFAYFKQSGSRDKGRKYMEVSPLEDYVMKMTLTQQGHLILPTMGDSGTYNTLYGSAIQNFANPLVVSNIDGKTELRFDPSVLLRFINYFETEYETIVENYKNEHILDANPERKIKNYHTKDKKGKGRNGYRFRYFGGFFKVKAENDNLKTFNDALEAAEKLDEGTGKRDNVNSVLKQIKDDWNKHSIQEKQDMMNAMLMDVFKGELAYAAELKIIEWDGNKIASVKNKALPSKALKEATAHYNGLGLDSKVVKALGATELLANYFANSISNIIEFEKLYIKDPAYYKDSVDKIKRLREALSTGVTPRVDYEAGHPYAGITEVNVGMLADNEIPSREFKRINEFAKRSAVIQLLQSMKNMTEADAVIAFENNEIPEDVEDAANAIVEQKFGGYDSVNQTDATVLISPDMYEQLVRRIDGWTPEVQKAFELLNNPEVDYAANPDIYNEALAVTLKPLKFMYFGDHFDAELGLDIPIFDKMAMFPVHRIFSTGDMAEVFKVMTNPDKPVHMLAFESAVKVGQYNNKPGIYNKDNTAINTEGLGTIYTHKQSLENFRRQLITDPHHSETQMFVTQAQKAASGNIRKNNKYVTPTGEVLTGQQVSDNIRDVMNALTTKGREAVEERFGVTTDNDGNVKVDAVKFAEVLSQDAESSNMNQNVIDGLQVKDGKTVAPISGLSDNSWIESRLISLLNKDIIDNNLPGGMFIQMSSILYNKIIVRSDEKVRRLRYCNDDGSMDAVVSINLLKHIIPDYKNKTFAEAKKWLIDNRVIGENASPAAMGYRIPAQGQSSTAALKIVDVYPEQIGDTITLPDEFTKLTGSDFDIDKLFLARYHYDNNGDKVKFLSKEEILQQKEENLRRLGFDDEFISKELYKLKQLSVYDLNSKEALENRLLDMYISVISNVNNFTEVRQPLDTVTDYLKDKILADVDSLIGKTKSDNNVAPLYYVTPQFQSKTKAELSGGKNGIAPFALAASHHALTQQVGLSFVNNKVLDRLGMYNISGISSQNNNYHKGFEKIKTNILDWLSAMINAHVDVAKDPYIIRLNVRKLTFNMTNLLLRSGKGEATFYFLPQQILKDFAVEYDGYSGFYGVDIPSFRNPESEAYNTVLKRYKKEAENLATPYQKKLLKQLIDKPQDYIDNNILSIPWLRERLDINNPNYKSFDWYYDQLRILLTYNALTPFAKELSELTALSQIDTKKFGNNFGLQSAFLSRWRTFLSDSKVFENPIRMFTSTFLFKKLQDGVVFPRIAFKNVMLRLTPEFESWRTKLSVMTGTLGSKNTDTINALTRSMEAQYKSAFFNKYLEDNNISLDDLLFGTSSVVNRFNIIKNKALRGEYPELLGSDGSFSNVLFKVLVPRMKYEKLDTLLPDFFELKTNKDADDNMDDLIIRAWEELLDSDNKEVRDFARDLALYAFYTSGDAFGRNNFFKWVPNSLRESLGYFDYIRRLEETPGNLNEIASTTNQIFRNLWWNEDIVPTMEYIRREESTDEDGIPTMVDTKLSTVPSGRSVLNDSDELLEIPGLVFNTRNPRIIGENSQGESIYTPYMKIRLNGDLDPRFTMLYRFVGVAEADGKTYPVYRLIPKLGVNYQGMTLTEFGKQKSSLYFNNYNYTELSNANQFGKFTPIKDIIPTNIDKVVDVFNFINEVGGLNKEVVNTNVQQDLSTQDQTTNPSDYTNNSGGAYGADTAWDTIGREFGVINHKHYRDAGNVKLSSKLNNSGVKATILSKEEMNKARTELSKLLGKQYPDTIEGNLQVRNYYQVSNSDAVYAIATLNEDKTGVTGGTNTAVQLGIKMNKPTYVWDLNTEKWYMSSKDLFGNNDGKFVETDTPTLTKNFAGVGTRDIEDYKVLNKETNTWESRKQFVGDEKANKALQAIRDVYEKTFNSEIKTVIQEQPTTRKTYSGTITELNPNQIFVFGSNTEGRHGKGAALTAKDKFGAVYGQAEGPQGQSYAIITKDLTKKTHPSRTPEQIKEQIHNLYEYAKQNPDKEFLVAYSGTGTNLNAYSNQEMADMFASESIPNNIVFEEEFNKLIQEQPTPEPSEISTEQTIETPSQLSKEFDQFVAENSNSIPVEVANQIKSEIPQAVEIANKLDEEGYTYTFGNGKKIKLDFKLNEQQIKALKELEAFVNSDDNQFTLSGYAGTGKTTVLSIFKQYLDGTTLGMNTVFTSPTHRANYVTKMKSPDAKVLTLASLFGITLDIDTSTNQYDLSTRRGIKTQEAKIQDGQLIIIDEASMVNDDLYNYITDTLLEFPNVKIIYVGDEGQLRPVKSNKKSKIFTDKDLPKVQLTKVERTGDNPILKESTRVRNGEGFSYQTEVNQYGDGVTFTRDRKQISSYIRSVLSSEQFKNNKLYFKILTATNDNVDKYNNYARQVLYGNAAPLLIKGELITGYDNKLKTDFGDYLFINSGDYVINSIKDSNVKINIGSEIVELETFACKLQNALDLTSNEFDMTFVKPNQKGKLIKLKNYIDALFGEYRKARAEQNWSRCKAILNKINSISSKINLLETVKDGSRVIFNKTADYGYASTIHKSQGGTYNKVLIDDGSINSFGNSKEVQQELRYVAISRASEDAMVVTSEQKVKPKEVSLADEEIIDESEIQSLIEGGKQNKEKCK